MLGLRGCRLGVLYPEIYEMQARAIFEAAIAAAEGARGEARGHDAAGQAPASCAMIKKAIDNVAQEVIGETGSRTYQVGTMIEIPRAALRAAAIAEQAEFFSFGTNDLTQMTLGLSRDDCGKFLERYLQQGIFEADPFTTLDIAGVGALVEIACKGRTPKRRTQARHLRRARRRSRDDRLLRAGRARLRVLLALSRADRAPRRGAGARCGARHGSRAGLSAADQIRSTSYARAAAGDGERARPDRGRAGPDAALALLEAAAARAPRTWSASPGPPGVGNQPRVAADRGLSGRERTVGVIAVDPSSRRSGGRCSAIARASRWRGETRACSCARWRAAAAWAGCRRPRRSHGVDALPVYDLVLVETVGVGQAETEGRGGQRQRGVLRPARLGDSLQYLKAGIAEIPDVASGDLRRPR